MNQHHTSRARRHIVFSLKIAGAIIVSALLLTLARSQGWIDQSQVGRAVNIVIGLGMVAYANVMPKFMHETPPRSLREATLAQAFGRVGSWAMTLGFLVWTALWAFAPRDIAQVGSIAAVVASMVVMFGYLAWKYAAYRTSKSE